MPNYLIIAEKKELAEAVRKAIQVGRRRIPQGNYNVLPAAGHLMSLKMPEEYDPKYKTWNLADLPIAFPQWQEVPIPGKENLLNPIIEAMKSADIIVNCGDPDDEGQYLCDQIIYAYMHPEKPVKRLLINDNSPEYIIRQLCHMEDNFPKHWLNGQGAYARSVSDAIFGFNYSRWYSVSYGQRLTVGRVQTPTLGLVVNRDRMIENHVARDYYELEMEALSPGDQEPITCQYVPNPKAPELEEGKYFDKTPLESIAKQYNHQTREGNVKRKIADTQPPLPFDMAELQGYCSKAFHYSPSQVMEITQSLRTRTLITYNRSDCRYLHEDMHKDAPAVLGAITQSLGISPPVDSRIKSKAFDDKGVGDAPHHAIIPTATHFDPADLSMEELNVYKAIALYYLIQFMTPCKKEVTTLVIPLQDLDKFTATSTKVIDPGFTAFMNKIPKDEITPLDRLPDGIYQFSLSSPNITEHKTTPPKRYTQASLIKDMTQVSKYAVDPRIKKMFLERDAESKNSGSIGTAATRDSIVKALIEKAGFLEEYTQGKNTFIRSTEKGRAFYDILPDQLKSLDTTVIWWEITQEIQRGKRPVETLTDSVLDGVREFLQNPPEVKNIEGLGESVYGKVVVGNCPRCGKPVVEGKKGYGCTGYKDDPPCKFTIWKTSKLLDTGKKSVTPAMAKALLKTGQTEINGLVSSKGTTYGGLLILEDTGEHVNLNFRLKDDAERSLGDCPRCGRPVVENSAGFGCTGFKDEANPCRFFISKNHPILAKSNKRVSKAMVKDLLKRGKCHVTGLVSSKGKTYSADFKLADDGAFVKLEMELSKKR